MYAEKFLHCPTCADYRLAEAPPCPDGHGAECPELICIECGTAVFADPALSHERARPAARRAA